LIKDIHSLSGFIASDKVSFHLFGDNNLYFIDLNAQGGLFKPFIDVPKGTNNTKTGIFSPVLILNSLS